MKKILLSSLAFAASVLGLNAQNTIPTTTVVGALSVNDSLRVSRDITASGDITSNGEVVSKDTMRAQKDVKVDGSVYIGDKLTVEGNAVFKNNLKAKDGITFTTGRGIGYIPSTPTSPNRFYYGSKVLGIPEVCAALPYPSAQVNHQFGGWMQVFSTLPNGDYDGSSGLLNFQTWSGGSSIDASVGGANAQTGTLLLNYFCGNNVSICQGSNGGIVTTGKNIEIGFPIRNTQTALNIALPTGITKAISVYNPALSSTNKTVFEVSNTGKTSIGTGRPLASGPASNAMLSVDGLILAREVKIAIASTHWADYVFNNDYKLMKLKEVEQFIKQNGHLPEVPSTKDVELNGVNVVETNAVLLKKIEELTLYLIEQNKEIESLKQEIKAIKK